MKPFFAAIGKSSLLHIALGIMLFISVDFDTLKPQPQAFNQPIVQAVAIDQKVVEEKLQRIEDEKNAKRRAEEKRIEDAKRKIQQQEDAKRKLEQDKIQKQKEKLQAEADALAAKKKQQIEKQKQEKAQAAKEAKEKREREEKAAKEKAAKEAEKKRQDAKEQAELERMMAEQLQSEVAERQKRRSAQVLTEVQKYQSLIRSTIQRNLIVDDSMNGKSCRLNIRLASNGLVTQVKILGGDKIVCEAARRAVFKSDTLPVSSEPDVYEQLRDINLTVEPEL